MRLVYIHLGEIEPSLLWLNIERSKELFPLIEHEVILSSDKWIRKAQRLGIKSYKYRPQPEVEAMLDLLNKNQKFRQGFWRFSLERLFALTQVMLLTGNKSILHIESDMLLLPNFPWNEFTKIENPAWFNFNETHDVASILYLPNSSSAKWLEERMFEEISNNNSLSDMTVLSEISRKNPDKVDILPTSPHEKSVILRSDSLTPDAKNRISRLTNQFNGYFDSAPIGMWVIGQDPHNHHGLIKLHVNLPESFIQPQFLQLSVSKENLFSFDYGINFPIYSLHVHSKNKKLFGKKWLCELEKFVVIAKDNRPLNKFSFTAFISTMNEVLKRHKWRIVKVLYISSIKK